MSATPGQTFNARIRVDAALVEKFADFSGDRNPIHVDPEEAKAYGHPRPVAHGAILVAFISKVIGMDVPGAGALWLGQTVEWLSPVYVGDEIDLAVRVNRVSTGSGVCLLDITATNQDGKMVMRGNAKVKTSERLTPKSGSPQTAQKVALVTGGAGGLGSSVALRLAADGLAVAIAYRSSGDAAEKLARDICSGGGKAVAIAADLADEASAAMLAVRALETFGRVDVLVHAASPSLPSVDAAQARYRDYDPFLRVYLGAALELARALSPGMSERRFGRLIFLGTAAMLGTPPPKWSAYLVAKHALWGLVKSLALELGPHGITANMVSPGMTVTELVAGVPARLKEFEARTIPARRLARPEDTSAVISFLAAETAGYINGVNLPVTGGPR